MKIDTKLNEMDDSSNRIMKYIRYFGKEMQADKILYKNHIYRISAELKKKSYVYLPS